MRRRCLAALAGAAAFAAILPANGRADAENCAPPADLIEVAVKLPHVGERLHARQPVKIVAIGGGSTVGAAAGAPDLAYPHRLEVALRAIFPEAPITVVNKGVPRQLTQQMVERFPTDVLAENPVLVVWETGITDAVRGVAIDEFAAALQSGIDAAKNRAIDIVLVDMQFSRRAAAVIDFERYLETIHRVGEVNEVYVFPRFAIMRYWSEQDIFNFEDVAEGERARLAARVYDCLGRSLAQAIAKAAQ